LRTLKSVLKHWQAAQKTERKSESESEIAMCDRMQMYNIITDKVYLSKIQEMCAEMSTSVLCLVFRSYEVYQK
jgi:hypothetical protein